MSHVLEVTGPIYLLMALGYLALRAQWLAPADLRVLGRFVVLFCLPALLFRSLAKQPLMQILQADYLMIYATGSLMTLGTVLLVARVVLGRPWSLAAMQAMGATGSNSAFVGYPIVLQVLGPVASLGLALGALVENLLVIPLSLMLAEASGSEHGRRQAFVQAFKGLGRNPLILSMLAGLAVSATGWGLPSVLDRGLGLVAAAAPPTALFVIGGSLVGMKLDGIRSDLALVAGGKLLLHPLCMWALVHCFPLAQAPLNASAVLFAAMPMMSIYGVLSQRFGHEKFCSAALLAATLGSFFTINALLAFLPAAWLVAAPAH